MAEHDLFEAIRKTGAITKTDEVNERLVPAIQPQLDDGTVLQSLHSELRAALAGTGITHLYQHQAKAVRAALKGRNVVLQSPPASGKTLAFQLPMLNTLLDDPSARALMIYPTKALAKDQEQQLTDLVQRLPNTTISLGSYDGDTPQRERQAVWQQPPQILRTNPDMLNASFLGWAEKYTQLYANLRWIIVDEVHEYRGYFGSNVALILRRFAHHLRQLYGVSPQLFMCSATCANAQDHAELLTGRDFISVDGSDALRPTRQYWSVQLDVPDAGYWDELRNRTVDAGLACLEQGKSVLVFCPTRIFAEECKRQADVRLSKNPDDMPGVTSDSIQVFRGGLTAGQRHKIQDGIHAGDIRLVFATNALELGINISGIDGVIMAGFPNNMMSARQQIGRAGRSWKSQAFVLYLPRNNPLDRYYATNIDELIERELDALVVNPENNVLVERHLPCTLYETPAFNGGKDLLGDVLYRQVTEKSGQFYRSRKRPHYNLDIRGGGSTTFKLWVGRRELGSMSGQQRFREAYEDGIYLHGGEAYRVESVTTTRNKAGRIDLVQLGDEDQYLRTIPKITASISKEEVWDGMRWNLEDGPIDVLYGQVTVTERIHVVEEIDERTNRRIRRWQPENSSSYWDGEGVWIDFHEVLDATQASVWAFEQMLRIGTLLTILADQNDLVMYAAGKEHRAYIVESFEGGIGIATQVLDLWREALEKGMAVALNCSGKCVEGCPRCIMPPRMRDQPDKQGGLRLAQQILKATKRPHNQELRNGFWGSA